MGLTLQPNQGLMKAEKNIIPDLRSARLELYLAICDIFANCYAKFLAYAFLQRQGSHRYPHACLPGP